MNVLKWMLAIIFYHLIMLGVIIMTIIMPFVVYGDIKSVLINEVPTNSSGMVIVSFLALFIYLAMRVQFLGIPYRKITILLPLLQMFTYTSFALLVGKMFLNKWADEALYSKGWAITLMLFGIVAIRLCMSLLYRRYPIVRHTNQ